MNWADAHGVGYEAWVWASGTTATPWSPDYGGTPYNAYGTWVRSHYLSLP